MLNLYIGHHNLTSEKKLSEKDKLHLVSAHIQLSAAIQSVSTRKDASGSEANKTQKQVKRVVKTMLCRNLRVVPMEAYKGHTCFLFSCDF